MNRDFSRKKKYYAVKRGRASGIFLSWEECKKQIDGFGGAVYRGFMTLSDAEAWLLDGAPGSASAGSASDVFLSRETSPEGTERIARDTKPPAPKLFDEDTPTLFAGGESYTVYTDGSCLKNPGGPGGYAAVIISPDGKITEISGGEPDTTNNRMEMRAGIESLRALPEGAVVEFFTDSQYLKNAFTKYWLRNWKRNGWRTSMGEPVKNQDLWKSLDSEISKRRVAFHWVKGHAGSRFNERCDLLARQEAASQKGVK